MNMNILTIALIISKIKHVPLKLSNIIIQLKKRLINLTHIMQLNWQLIHFVYRTNHIPFSISQLYVPVVLFVRVAKHLDTKHSQRRLFIPAPLSLFNSVGLLNAIC